MQNDAGDAESPPSGDAESPGFAPANAPVEESPAADPDRLSVESRILSARTTNLGEDSAGAASGAAASGTAVRLFQRSGSRLLLPCPHCGRATPKSRKDCVQCGAMIAAARTEAEYDTYNQDRSNVHFANVDEWRSRAETSQKLIELIVGRTVICSDYDGNQFVVEFDDGSHLIVETTGATSQLAPVSNVTALQQGFAFDAPELHLEFEDSASLDLPLAAWFNSVMVMSKENTTLYAD